MVRLNLGQIQDLGKGKENEGGGVIKCAYTCIYLYAMYILLCLALEYWLLECVQRESRSDIDRFSDQTGSGWLRCLILVNWSTLAEVSLSSLVAIEFIQDHHNELRASVVQVA